MSITISNLLKLGIQLGIFIAFYIYFVYNGSEVSPNIKLALLPMYICIMGLTGLGLGMILSALTTKYRDLTVLVSFGVSLLMYISAVPFPMSEILEKKPSTLNINTPQKRISGLSISSLKFKKEHQLNKKEVLIDKSELPKSKFTEEEMQKHWADFVQKIDAEGKKILASNLNTDIPKLKDETTIWIELPNDTMKKEIEREQFGLITHLKEKLNNHLIKIKITVNETINTKFAFTPEEKYEKLREKNPIIDLLRREFDLDL
jgi:hypothetical protein